MLSNILQGFLAFTAITGVVNQVSRNDESVGLASNTTPFHATTETGCGIGTLPRMTKTEAICPSNTDTKTTVTRTIKESTNRTTTATETSTVTETKPITHHHVNNVTVTEKELEFATEYAGGTATVAVRETPKIVSRAHSSIVEALGSKIWQVITWIVAAIILSSGWCFGIIQYMRTRAWYVSKIQLHVDQSRQERDDAITARGEANERADRIEREYQAKEDEHRERFGKVQIATEKVFGKIPTEDLDDSNWQNLVEARLSSSATESAKKIQQQSQDL